MQDRRSVGLDHYTAKKMQEKLDEANEQRKSLGRKPLKVCNFMVKAVDVVTVAQLIRI